MSIRGLALNWSVDATAVALLAQFATVATIYLAAVARGNRVRPRRPWPRQYTLCFLLALAVAAVDLCSGIGAEADDRLSAHMLEHMILWVIVAPLLAAGAPVRLAFHALPRGGRRTLARCLHSPPVVALTSPVGSVSLFCAVIVVTQIPAVYGLTLSNEYLHEAEHGLYLLSALLLWAPLIGADPLPHRASARGQVACMLACMLPMVLVALWLATASDAIYGHYVAGPANSALEDQRLAATIMLVAGLPAFAIPALARARLPGSRRQRPVRPQRAHA